MAAETLQLGPTADPRVFLTADGKQVTAPPGWVCLPPGDAGLTRRVKAAGPTWTVSEKRGRKVFSLGVWAAAAQISAAQAVLASERDDPAYAKRLTAARSKRAVDHAAYVETFATEVHAFLRFGAPFVALASRVATAVTLHATPVGSGTVARTKRISVDERASAAVMAWMRHQTTAYDHMKIARVRGERRKVRRELAQISHALLEVHRGRTAHAALGCPLCEWAQKQLRSIETPATESTK
jgi:hypothetical protein